MSVPPFVARLRRTTLAALVGLTLVVWAARPAQPEMALGVVGGGALIGLAYWGLRGLVETVAQPRDLREKRPDFRWLALVKFFTRHAILALAAYGMMARLELHPIGLLIGVSAPAVAAAVESMRARRH